jgi:AraC family transcriptional regulator
MPAATLANFVIWLPFNLATGARLQSLAGHVLPNLANLDYVARVNRAVDYVTQHLAEPLRLEDVAKAACFSPYHFHRIFQALMGETLASFVKRVRLERAIALLSHRPDTRLTEIAFSCGFASSSDFSRSFRAHYGVPPRRFDVQRFRSSRREAMRVPRLPEGTNPDGFAVALRTCPPRRVAYIRVHRPYEGDAVPQAAARLLAWAEARGLAGGQWLGYQWDDPEIVPLEKCRYDIGLEVPGATAADGEVSITEFASCLMAEVEIAGPVDVELRALDWFYRTWLPTSGYAPAHQPMFEAFNGRPFAHGMAHFELRAQLPVIDERVPLP